MVATIASVTDSPAQNGILVGLLFQGAGCGQVIGPLLFGAIIDLSGGWSTAPLYFLVSAAIGFLILSRIPTTLARL